jgi:hypothetical protein
VLTETLTADEEPRRTPEPAPLKARFTSSPRGASLARQAAVRHMETWGHPPASEVSCTVVLLVAELAANAVHTATPRATTSASTWPATVVRR